jgi:3-oxoacyl-[acyl-carrier protein] reductase
LLGREGEVTEESFHKMFNLNVLGLILTSQEALKYFGPEGGSIINIGSTASSLNVPTAVTYTPKPEALPPGL